MKPLTTEHSLEHILQESEQQPVLVFKHSENCSISMDALREFQNFIHEHHIPSFIVTVQKARHVSNALASRLMIRHESPQAILLSGARAVWSGSHRRISGETLRAAVQSLQEETA